MYTFRYGDQEYQLVEATDLVVVRTEEAAALEQMPVSSQSRELLPSLIPIMYFPEANVTVYKIVADDAGQALRMRNLMRRRLPEEAGIRFAGRVLKDKKTGTIFVYTENFFIKFRDEVPPARCEEIIRDHGLLIKEALPFAPGAYFLAAPEGAGLKVFAIANELLALPEVESCHPELVREKKEKFVYPLQWHLRATTINGLFIDQNVDIDGAWALSRGQGVTIAVIDDGFDLEHEEFALPGKIVHPRNTVRGTDNPRPIDPAERHGTACAGVACAAGRHKAAGVAPEARLMPIKSGGLGSMAEAKAFAWAADQGADVISCSWGPADGPWYDPMHPAHQYNFALPDSTRLALEYALRTGRGGRGCVICWAAGNGNEDVRYDGYASHPGVIAVAACNDRGRRSVYSDFGEAVWCCFPSNDIYAPQLNHPRPLTAGIWTTDRQGNLGYNGGGVDAEAYFGDLDGKYTATFGGTSSACPGVAGVCALVLAVNPNLNWQQVKDLLRRSCDVIDPQFGNYDAAGHSPYYGYGRVNAAHAVQQAAALAGDGEHFSVTGVARFCHAGEAPLRQGEWCGDFPRRDRLMGLWLRLEPAHPDLGIRYRIVLNRLGADPFAAAGQYSGTGDRRRKVIGFAAELTGPLAARFEIVYQVRLRGEAGAVTARNGQMAGELAGRGDAIEQIRVEVVRRAGL